MFNKARDDAARAQGLDTYPASQPVQKPAVTSTPAGVPNYMSAEEEKAALRRYEDAKRAVQMTQLGGTDDVGTSSSSSYVPPPAANELPPSFEASVPAVDARTQLAEKERLQRDYEARDAAAAKPASLEDAPAYSHNPEPQPLTGTIIQSAIAEKEMLRRKFEMMDAQARGSPSQPPRQASPVQPKTRPTPAPPTSSRILTAAEEKAMLRARFEAEDSAQAPPPAPEPSPPPQINGYSYVNGYTNGTHAGPSTPSPSVPTFNPPPAPPPLAPKPPAAYIQETQEEDARVSRYVNAGAPLPDLDYKPGGSLARNPSAGSGLDMRPFTPFSAGFDANSKSVGLPPPLPRSNKRD